MRRRSCILTLALMGVLALLCSPVSAQAYSQHRSGGQVDVGIFYDSLAPYGDWVEMPDYGWSWAPRVEHGWRPYTRGQWVMTDDGWYWDSDERFSWAAYHYGRWVNHPYYGWVWIPGTEWAPAWVSWRHGNGYTGWAPLPPRATWQTHVGLSIGGLDIDAFIGARDYAFVRDGSFLDRGVYQQVLPPTQNVTIINVTNNVTNYTVVNQRVVNSGIAVANVERAVGRRVQRVRTVDADRADAPRHARAGEVAVFRPEVRAAPERRPAQGRSLVKGDEPPPLLVERRKQREQERQQKGNDEAEVTAKDVQKQRPADQQGDKEQKAADKPQTTPRTDTKAAQQETQRQREQAQANKQAKDAQLAREQQQLDQQRAAKRNSDAQAQADKQAKDAQLAREQKQLDQQRAAKRDSDAQAQADKQAKDAQLAREQKQLDQQRAAKPNSDAQAQADKQAKDAQQEAKDNPKGKGKKNPKEASPTPTPPPAGQEQ